ncbi:tRNA-dihydrouridine synthase [Candidatus Microgenomates bacterium]|nr:MAG: tRNA-dihydrouridine synthase [Candidatus Microgenomates bacterium]
MKSFWQDLPKPIFALAPMEDVTDTVFRQIVADCARPDVFFTEFTSVDGMFSRGQERVMHRLQFTEIERPLIAQIWGLVPENFFKSAQRINKLGFDGIDINMGCPERSVVKKGACSALIKNHALATEIIQATQKGAGNLPVSIKTRIGFNQIVTDDWIGFLLQHQLDALIIHLRTSKEMSTPPPHWEEMEKIMELRDKISPRTIILANGDIMDRADGLEKINRYKLDGVMIGRGIFKNLWAFENSTPPQSSPSKGEEVVAPSPSNRSLSQMLVLLRKHMYLYQKTWAGKKSFLVLRRFFKIYVSGFAGASKLREELMKTKSVEDVNEVLDRHPELASGS